MSTEELYKIRVEYNKLFEGYMNHRISREQWLATEQILTKRGNILRNQHKEIDDENS